MRREEALARLTQHLPELRQQFAIASLALFGSTARDEAGSSSDVDILVTFSGEPTFRGYMGLKEALEALLGCTVDLVTTTGLRRRIRDRVLAESLHVA